MLVFFQLTKTVLYNFFSIVLVVCQNRQYSPQLEIMTKCKLHTFEIKNHKIKSTKTINVR